MLFTFVQPLVLWTDRQYLKFIQQTFIGVLGTVNRMIEDEPTLDGALYQRLMNGIKGDKGNVKKPIVYKSHDILQTWCIIKWRFRPQTVSCMGLREVL